ncbi:hypothetical protein [Prevotella sp. AM42-24]|uniref:hypothetical protein n=1 Tax=Prevotella sp. AM42-24 TaxID=2293125 RepID=UPI0018F475D1|nr:hypothetical protein [Prevotella sp. AM42-24]
MRRIIVLILMSAVIQTVSALGWHNINVDFTTITAMGTAYGVEGAEEGNTATALDSIFQHYKSGSIAMAGIFVSKKNDRDAMRNPGLFASEENYYYKRIYSLVKDGIMPKFITVAAQFLKYPENALYWGPYLLKTTSNVENLCKEFELVATNGKRSFKDIKFLVVSDDLKKLFDLAKLGNVNWKALLDKLGDFGKGLSKEDLKKDMKHFGDVIASAGQQTVDANLEKASKIGNIFHSSTDSIWMMYDKFRETYEQVKNGAKVKDLLMQVIVTPDAAGVARLFKIDDYNLTGYITNYLKELKGQYYTQRWYIYTEDSGTKVICTYKPDSYEDRNDSRWNTAWNHYISPKDNEYCHSLTTAEKNEIKNKANSLSGWNQEKVNVYNQNNPGHTCSITYTLNHEDRRESYKHGWGSTHHKRHCFYSYSVKVVDSWYIKQEIYEETFDSQSMDKETFEAKLKARLKSYNDNLDPNDENYGKVYKLGSDAPRFYTMADEKKLEGCNTVSFVANCSGGANLGEGSFNWKENSKSQKGSLTEQSKQFAMANNPDQSSDGGDKELLQQKQQYTNEVNSLKKQISANDKKQQDLIDRIRAAKQANNYPLANRLQKEYDSLDATNAQLQNQLSVAQNNLNQTNQALTEYYNDMSDNLDGAYRIPSNMRELQAMYKLQWQDEGEWVNGSGEYTFVRHAYCPSAKANVTYTAVLKLARKPKYFLGIRIHRPILSVDFTLSGNSSAENVVEVMKLDMKKTEKERTEEVNKRLKELMKDMPDCSISIRYEYSNKVDTSDDESDNSIHLLWASDRLDIARDVEYQLTEIYAQLVFLEHVMQARQSLLDFLKHQILDVVTRSGRGTIAEYCLQRWEDASIAAMSKTNNVKKDSTAVNNNTGNK